jgi:hypothetical protein
LRRGRIFSGIETHKEQSALAPSRDTEYGNVSRSQRNATRAEARLMRISCVVFSVRSGRARQVQSVTRLMDSRQVSP